MYRGGDAENHFSSDDLTNEHFPKGKYQDVKGLCNVASLDEIEAQGWSLNLGRYVGIAKFDDDGGDFHIRLEELNEELETLNSEAREFEDRITNSIMQILR